MPPRSLHARLVLSLLLILLPVLGGGGFFWFRGEARHMQADFDAALLALADQAGGLLRSLPGDDLTAEPCTQLQALSRRLADDEGAAIFAPDGSRLCRFGLMAQPDLLDPQTVSRLRDGQKVFATRTDAGQTYRILKTPVFKHGQLGSILLLSGSYQSLQEQQRQLAWTLSGLLLLVLSSAFILAWLAVRQQLRPLAQLSEWIDELRENKIAAERPASSGGAAEVLQLQASVADLLNGLASDLARSRQFTADASHELRTPLTILRGETEVALRWAQDPEETRKVLASNLEEIDRMSRIIEDLLLLSKSEVGEMPLQFERIELVALLEELYLQTRLLGEKKGIAVHFEAPGEKVQIQGDSLRLRQLFLNLLSNAVKYTPSAGRVELKLVLLGALVEVRVVDTGIGIAPKHQTLIFDRFYRVDKARNRSDGGSGLGLSISQWVAESHGGHIKVHSEPGKGSEFIVVLPLEQEARGRL